MRIAVLSDVHGNLPAFESVLEDIDRQHVDLVVNLGDLFSGGIEPSQTADRMMGLGHVVIRGNHERQLLDTPRESLSPSDRWAADQLDQRHMEWIARLPGSAEPAPGVLAIHGSPRSDMEYLLETVDQYGAHPATLEEIDERIRDIPPTEVLLCGHSHLARIVQAGSGVLIVNPGSVGWPAFRARHPEPHVMEAGSPHARYAIVERVGQEWAVSLRAIPYHWDTAARIATANGRPDISSNLLTGWA
ncbi:MAG: metallophosphatase family protein [Propionibacteriaceae bacterium]|nr:metallophosphatase family protein [Propionibacteriaceae bacterium]